MTLNLAKSGRAAIVALTLGAASITAMPVQAQEPSFSFKFGISGGGADFSYGIRNGKKFKRECLSNNEVRRGLRDNGFRDITFLDRQGVRVKVYAEWKRKGYIVTVNRCTGRITDIDRVKLRGGGKPGFGVELRF